MLWGAGAEWSAVIDFLPNEGDEERLCFLPLRRNDLWTILYKGCIQERAWPLCTTATFKPPHVHQHINSVCTKSSIMLEVPDRAFDGSCRTSVPPCTKPANWSGQQELTSLSFDHKYEDPSCYLTRWLRCVNLQYFYTVHYWFGLTSSRTIHIWSLRAGLEWSPRTSLVKAN